MHDSDYSRDKDSSYSPPTWIVHMQIQNFYDTWVMQWPGLSKIFDGLEDVGVS